MQNGPFTVRRTIRPAATLPHAVPECMPDNFLATFKLPSVGRSPSKAENAAQSRNKDE